MHNIALTFLVPLQLMCHSLAQVFQMRHWTRSKLVTWLLIRKAKITHFQKVDRLEKTDTCTVTILSLSLSSFSAPNKPSLFSAAYLLSTIAKKSFWRLRGGHRSRGISPFGFRRISRRSLPEPMNRLLERKAKILFVTWQSCDRGTSTWDSTVQCSILMARLACSEGNQSHCYRSHHGDLDRCNGRGCRRVGKFGILLK